MEYDDMFYNLLFPSTWYVVAICPFMQNFSLWSRIWV